MPADRPERFAKAVASGAGAVVLDLEDAVAPERKDIARRAIQAHGLDAASVVIRINAASSGHHEADLAALAGASFAAVMLAKAEEPQDLVRLASHLPPHTLLLPLVETVLGLTRLSSILESARSCRVAFGAFDFSLDVGCQPSWEPLLLARSEIVWRSRAAGSMAPLDSPSTTLENMTSVEEEATRVAALGFGGKLAIHPRQIESIDRAFRPDAAAVAWAMAVVAAGADVGAQKVGGQMVDKPVLERATRILARAGSVASDRRVTQLSGPSESS